MIEWLVKHSAPVMLVVMCITLFGGMTYNSLPRESTPDVKIPVVMVTTAYIGVSPKDIETLVTIPLESELSGIKDLKKMSSTSAEGVCVLALEFEPEVVIDEVMQRVRDAVARVKPKLPPDIEEPDIREINFEDFPVMIVTLGGDVDEEQLKKYGEKLEDDLKGIKGVLDAKLSGGRTREIRVQLDPGRLQHYALAPADVIGAISAENVNIPGGNVSSRTTNYLLRVPGEFTAPSDIEQVAIKRIGDRPVFVRDVAKVVDGFADRASYSRMNGQPAVSIAVSKRTGANILEVATEVKEIAAEHAKKLPEGVEYRILGDQSRHVNDMVSELENNIITALLLVIAVIFFAMGFRNSFFVSGAIPLSMLLGMIAIAVFGMTLNMVVLFSLILALGMLVDNAIVLVENVYRHLEEGSDLKTASIEGTKEIAGAVTASTLTTVAAFAPLVFWKGVMGQFMGYLPKTVIIMLVSSLVIAIGVLPVLTARAMKKAPAKKRDPNKGAKRGLLMRGYRAVLTFSIRHRYISAGLVTASLIGTFAAYGSLNHGTEFFPSMDPDQATITVRAPDGTDLEETDRIVRRLEALLANDPNVDVFVVETGVAGGGDPLSGAQAAANQARITVDFPPHATKWKKGDKWRVENTNLTIDRLRAAGAEIPGARITVDRLAMGPPVGPPLAVEVSGDDFQETGALAARVRRELGDIEGVTDLTDNYRVGRPEMRLRIDRGAAKRVGSSTQAVASAVRTSVAGTKASTLRDGEDEYDIKVELAPEYRNDLQAVLALRIPGRIDTSPDTFAVPLSTVATYELAGGSGSIRHIDQDMIVTITGDVVEGYNQNAVRAEVAEYLHDAERPAGYKMRLGGADDEQQMAQEFLGRAFLIAIFLIGIVLVSQFNSFITPFIILGSVVLSLVGVLWGLIITGTPFGIVMTGIGVISLAGVVVNNAIVLLDYVEQLRRQGSDMFDALVEAGTVRFRPVMLTAITTILGLVPMAAGFAIDFGELKLILESQSAGWWGPMAVAVIFGLAFATVLTLVMVPTFYSIREDILLGSLRLWRWVRREPKPAPAE